MKQREFNRELKKSTRMGLEMFYDRLDIHKPLVDVFLEISGLMGLSFPFPSLSY